MILNGALKRVVIPAGQVTNVNEVTYDDTSAVGYAVTLSALPDSEGNTHYEYFKSTGGSTVPDTTLSALTIGGVALTPAFLPTITSYTAATTDSTNTITATASDNSASVVIKNGDDTVTSGSAATWTAGANAVTVTVTKGGYTKTYNINVTKS